MTFLTINLLCPVILAIHNLDEYSRYDNFVRTYHSRLPVRFISRRVIRNAAILVTMAVALLAGSAYMMESPRLILLSKVAVLAIMLNAIGHCLLSIKRGSLVPGSLSAIALVLPYSFVEIAAMRTSLGDSLLSLLHAAVLGALALPAATLLFLFLGYGFAQLAERAHKP